MQDRFDEYKLKLDSIAKHFQQIVGRHNGAIIVRYNDRAHDRRGSIGAHRLLCNYYRPSAEEQQQLNNAKDVGKERSTQAFHHAIDKATFHEKFTHLIPALRYEAYDEALIASNTLSNQCNMVSLGYAEFTLGSRRILVNEFPHEGAQQLHLTGALDALFYNRATGKLVLVEQKSGFPQNNARFFSMEQLYLKEQHAKQLTLYACLLLLMAEEAGVPLVADDLELCLLANNKARHQLSAWRMQFDPVTFLGETWAAVHWYAIIIVVNKPMQCCFCGRFDELKQTVSKPIITLCMPCFDKHRCVCGKLGRYMRKSTNTYVCERRCGKAFIK